MNGYPKTIPQSEQGTEELSKQLDIWMHACHDTDGPPLLNAVLHLNTPYVSPRTGECETSASTRLSAATPRPNPFANESRSSVRLARAVHTGIFRGFAQVYAARFLPERTSDVDIVVKVFQGSYSHGFRTLVHDRSIKVKEWEMQLMTFEDEAWAYTRLADLQGSLVPHVRGFFEVMLPHGEPAIALAMEYIDGCKCLPLPEGYQSSPFAFHAVMDKLLRAVHDMMDADVFSLDMAPRNILWPPLPPSGDLPYPIFIDFNLISSGGGFRTTRAGDVFEVARGYGFKSATVTDWVERNVVEGSDLVRWFEVEGLMISHMRNHYLHCAEVEYLPPAIHLLTIDHPPALILWLNF